jgi:hypothetical protein
MAAPSTPRVVDGAPSSLPLMLKAALPLVPGVNLLPGLGRPAAADATLPDLALTRHDVPVDAARVRRYAEVCGFPRKDTLPVTYPHLLAFPLHLAVMTDASFPIPAIGTVHLENSLTQHRPLLATETFQVTVRPDGLRAHPKGQAFDLVTSVHARGELVWEEISTFLRRSRGDAQAPSADGQGSDGQGSDGQGSTFDLVPQGTTQWRLGGDLGRRYAAVSGDYNPIHLHALTAKAFGFPRQIAHGMWSLARCLAAVENRLPDAVRVDAAFKKPVLLPTTVSFGTAAVPDGQAFALADPTDGSPHLVGRAVGL